jgi:hypothetical protein
MRFGFRLSLVGLVAISPALCADTIIEWDRARPLTWDDFQGKVRAGADNEQVAESMTSLTWSFRYEIEWAGDECVYTVLDITSTAEFHPGGSWVRPDKDTPDILEHEQIHFDITQIHRELFADAVDDVIGKSRACPDGSRRSATRNVERALRDFLGESYDKIWRAHLNEQAAYDSETRHGINRSRQRDWATRVRQSLGLSGISQ